MEDLTHLKSQFFYHSPSTKEHLFNDGVGVSKTAPHMLDVDLNGINDFTKTL